MLVLSRKVDEAIVINPGTPYEARIVITEIRHDKVRLGVQTDRSVPIHREEVWKSIQRERSRKDPPNTVHEIEG